MNLKKWFEFRQYLENIARVCMATWKDDGRIDGNV